MLLKFNFSSIFLIKFVYMLSNLLFVKNTYFFTGLKICDECP